MKVVQMYKLCVSLFMVSCFLSASVWAKELPDFTEMVDDYSPAVVNISTTQKIQRTPSDIPHGWGGQEGPGPGTPFDDFFRRFFGDEGDGHGEGFETESLGSGFVISKDGYIITNAHVIHEADEIIVRLSDRRELVATVIGSDKRSDIALLKVDADDLPVVRVGNPEKLKVGSWVLAIGSPFGFDHSVTAGIVSAKGRSLPNENYVPFIQTDVAINPGNSGGPLFNLAGEVVGVNAQIYSRTGGYMGLAFAIPIDVVMNVVDQIKSTGHVTRGWLGILIQDVTRELAESFGMSKPMGALVSKVLPGSPAEQAGFKVGDIVVGFNGREVGSSAALPPMVGSSAIGKTADVKIIRDGKSLHVKVEINELPGEEVVQLTQGESGAVRIDGLAIEVSNLNNEERSELEIDKGGVYVDVVKDGPASQGGVRKGDVILKVNNIDIDNAQQLRGLAADLPVGRSFPILVLRRSGPVFLAIKITDE